MTGIVSLLPAATEIVCALGLRERLLARSHECDTPADVTELPPLTRSRIDPHLPSEELDRRVKRLLAEGTPLYEIDEALLERLRPDVVVTQAACDVCAISYEQVAGSVGRSAPGARVVSLQPARLADVWQDVRTVADACGVSERAVELLADIERRLDRVRRESKGGPRPRVAVLEWLAPPMLAGHWIPDVIEAAGGTYVGPAAGAPSPYVSWEDLGALRPDALVVAPCGFDLRRTLREVESVRDTLSSIAPRTLVMDGNAYLNRPGPRLMDAVEHLATWLRGGGASPELGCVELSSSARA